MPDLPPPSALDKLLGGSAGLDGLDRFLDELQAPRKGLPDRINTDPEKVEAGLARLVLALVDLLRQLLEKQALRRVEGGSLTDEEIERLGQTFLRLDARMAELKEAFGVKDDDLDLRVNLR